MKKRRNGWGSVLCLVGAVLLTGGCGQKDETYKRIVDDYAEIILKQDQDSAVYDHALEAVEDYLKQPDEEARAQTEALLLETIKQMEEDSSQCTPYEMEEDFSELLKNHGIEPEEYCMNAEARADNLDSYISNLEYLAFHLEKGYAEQEIEEVEFGCRYYLGEQKDYRGFNHCGINYWFAGWEEEAVQYVKQQVLDKLESFYEEEPVWEEDRMEVERRMNLYLDNVEERGKEWTEHVGKQKEEADRLQQEQIEE